MTRQLFGWGNLALAFGLELAGLAALGYWGWHTGPGGLLTKVALGVGAPLSAALLWGVFASPRAPVSAPAAAAAVRVAFFLAAAAAMLAVGHQRLGAAFLVLVILNSVLLQRPHVSASTRSAAPPENDRQARNSQPAPPRPPATS